MNPDDPEFDVSRAELFEALGHKTRIRILQALDEKPMSFSELKKATEVESSGLLSFHLGKLTHLAGVTQDGNYALTDQGKEALRMIHVTRSEGTEPTIRVRNPAKKRYIAAIAVLLVCLVASGSLVVYQQQQIASLNHTDSGQAGPDTLLYGTVTESGMVWLAGFTATPVSSVMTFLSASGTSYTAQPNAAGQYWVSLPKNDNYSLVVHYTTSVKCVESCESLVNKYAGINNITGSTTPISTTPPSGVPLSHCDPSGCEGELSINPSAAKTMNATGYCEGENLELGSADAYNFTFWC